MSERNEICARMPDGSYVETWANALTIKGKQTVALGVKCTVDYEVPKDKLYQNMESGFRENEIGLYLPTKKMWVFKRTSPNLQEFACLLQEWLVTYLSGNESACVRMFAEMEQAESKKEARKIQSKFYRIHGTWQFGLKKATRTKGLKNLLERAEEFDVDPTVEAFKPRIAWRI